MPLAALMHLPEHSSYDGRLLQQVEWLAGASLQGFIISMIAVVVLLAVICGGCIRHQLYHANKIAPEEHRWRPSARSLIAFHLKEAPTFSLPDDMLAEVMRVYKIVDKDGNGILDASELSVLTSSPLVPPGAFERCLDDGTGTATSRQWVDFFTLLAAKSKTEAKRQLTLFEEQASGAASATLATEAPLAMEAKTPPRSNRLPPLEVPPVAPSVAVETVPVDGAPATAE